MSDRTPIYSTLKSMELIIALVIKYTDLLNLHQEYPSIYCFINYQLDRSTLIAFRLDHIKLDRIILDRSTWTDQLHCKLTACPVQFIVIICFVLFFSFLYHVECSQNPTHLSSIHPSPTITSINAQPLCGSILLPLLHLFVLVLSCNHNTLSISQLIILYLILTLTTRVPSAT